MLNFTVVDGVDTRRYEGFERLHNAHLKPGDKVVIAWFEGEPEPWQVDGEQGIQALRHYRDNWDERLIPFHILTAHSSDVFR